VPTSASGRWPAARARASPFSRALAGLGEQGILRAIRPYLSPAKGDLLVGAREDDDAAVWRSPGGALVATVDTMVEGRDFRLDWPGFGFRLLGRRLMSVNLSDLAAMGADPSHALVSLALTPRLDRDDLRALYRGIADRARSARCTVAGGDVSATSGPLVLTVALFGHLPDGRRPLTRRGARAGWTVAVTGVLGRAAAGLRLLLEGRRPRTAAERRWVRALFDPQPRLLAARQLQAAGVRVAGDISDGIYRELQRIAEPAGLGVLVDADRLPLDADLRREGKRAWTQGLIESEDYELVCAAPARVIATAQRRLWSGSRLSLTPIGSLTAAPGIRVRSQGATVSIPQSRAGYDHFG